MLKLKCFLSLIRHFLLKSPFEGFHKSLLKYLYLLFLINSVAVYADTKSTKTSNLYELQLKLIQSEIKIANTILTRATIEQNSESLASICKEFIEQISMLDSSIKSWDKSPKSRRKRDPKSTKRVLGFDNKSEFVAEIQKAKEDRLDLQKNHGPCDTNTDRVFDSHQLRNGQGSPIVQ